MIKYEFPRSWIRYEPATLANDLAEAKAAVLSLARIPFQKSWVEKLQQMELKREVAGTSRIEGADFTERELDAAMRATPEELHTRSQRQARAAVVTYRWIVTIPHDLPIDEEFIREIHRSIVTNADDDHCPPGRIRIRDENVNFGAPRHRGVEGGDECERAFSQLVLAMQREYPNHDPLIRALAAHYHFAAMHPFLDGNGRTARALEALMLQRAGLRDTCFIAMSNYYYEEKNAYLTALAETRARDHDLTPFLSFGLKGIARQAHRLLTEIQREVSKALFKNLMFDLFNRLRTPKKRVIAERQLELLKVLLDQEEIELEPLLKATAQEYSDLTTPRKAAVRDLNGLISLQAIKFEKRDGKIVLSVRLEWPTEITETTFFERLESLPKAKTHKFLQ